MTILENIIEAPIHVLGKEKTIAEIEAMELLKQVGIEDKANDYPVHLSGGQQQRAAIAEPWRSRLKFFFLMNQPHLLILS